MTAACIERHARARVDSALFATFIQKGVTDGEDDDGNPIVVRWANCSACKSTICKERGK